MTLYEVYMDNMKITPISVLNQYVSSYEVMNNFLEKCLHFLNHLFALFLINLSLFLNKEHRAHCPQVT